MIRVLHCAIDDERRGLRAALLRLRGCQVVTPGTIHEAVTQMVNDEHYDVLLLCNELGIPNAEILCKVFRRRFPSGRIVAIAFSDAEALALSADVTVEAGNPDAMVRAVMGERGMVIPFRRRA